MSLVSSLTFVTPFVNLLFISFMLGESIKPIHFLGMAVILTGVALQLIKAEKKETQIIHGSETGDSK